MPKWIVLVAVIFSAGCSYCLAETPRMPASQRTARLAEWEGLKYGMFLHFGISTFEGAEHSRGQAPSTTYAPTQLDVRQWIQTARQAGMKYAVLTAKHVGGHCLWDSSNYDYDVATSGDKTDVVAEFMKACKEEDIKPCLYYCIYDSHNEGGLKRRAAIKDDYFQLIKRHITELHTRYPGIYVQWIDIPEKLSSEQRYELYRLVKKLTPDCIVMMNQGFKDGVKVPMNFWPTDLLDGERVMPPPSGHNPVKVVEGKTYYLPLEVCDTISQRWFWVPNDPPKSVRSLYKLYCQSVGRGGNLLLNVPPDKAGRIPQYHVDALLELKKVIDNPALLPPPESLAFGCPTKASSVWGRHPKWGSDFAVDDDMNTRWAAGKNVKQAWLEIDLGKPVTFDHIRIVEKGNRVQKFVLQAKRGDAWTTFASGTTIGQNAEIQFEPLTAQEIRLDIRETTDSPSIRELQVLSPK